MGLERLFYDTSTYTGICKQAKVGEAFVDGHVDFAALVDRDRSPLKTRRWLSSHARTFERGLDKTDGATVKTSSQGPERSFYGKTTCTGTHKHCGPSLCGPFADLVELVDWGNPKNAAPSPPRARQDVSSSPLSPQVFPRLLGRTR